MTHAQQEKERSKKKVRKFEQLKRCLWSSGDGNIANIATRYTCSCKTERTPRLRIVEHIAGMVEINNTKRSESGSLKMVDIV